MFLSCCNEDTCGKSKNKWSVLHFYQIYVHCPSDNINYVQTIYMSEYCSVSVKRPLVFIDYYFCLSYYKTCFTVLPIYSKTQEIFWCLSEVLICLYGWSKFILRPVQNWRSELNCIQWHKTYCINIFISDAYKRLSMKLL